MARDSLHVDTQERKPVIHETFVTDSTNVMRLFQFARDPNIHFETYVNGVCVAGLALHTFTDTRIQSHGKLLEEVFE